LLFIIFIYFPAAVMVWNYVGGLIEKYVKTLLYRKIGASFYRSLIGAFGWDPSACLPSSNDVY
jgi:hypothetical protein